jgi:hypothetical protein
MRNNLEYFEYSRMREFFLWKILIMLYLFNLEIKYSIMRDKFVLSKFFRPLS